MNEVLEVAKGYWYKTANFNFLLIYWTDKLLTKYLKTNYKHQPGVRHTGIGMGVVTKVPNIMISR
jgi:cytochrome c2